MSDPERKNVYALGAFDPEALFQSIDELRETMLGAWRERAVLLTPEEQKRLRQEIRDTGELLLDLTAPTRIGRARG